MASRTPQTSPLTPSKVGDHPCCSSRQLHTPSGHHSAHPTTTDPMWHPSAAAAAALKVGGLRLANIIRAKGPAGGTAGQLQEQQHPGGAPAGEVVARIRATAAG